MTEHFEDYEKGWEGPDICDKCSNTSSRLKLHNGEIICEDCIDE